MTDRPSLSVVTGTDFEALLDEGRRILDTQSAASWAFADWAARPELAARPVRDIAKALRISRGKIGEYREISKTWPLSDRSDRLAFSHHLAAARAPETERADILRTAAESGWTTAQTRAAAREATLEGKVARQAAELRALKRALQSAKADARDTARAARARLEAERRVAHSAAGSMAGLAEELAEAPVLENLHGNARRGLARDIRKAADRLADGVNHQINRLAAAADAIEGGG